VSLRPDRDSTCSSLADERSISPTIGVVFFVGIVLVLATVSGVLFLGLTDDQPVAPQVRLVLETTDSEVTYDIVHRSGDALDGDRIKIRGINDPDVMADQRLTATESVEVLPTEKTITVVWFSRDRGESDVLQRFEVDGPTILADENCEWVEKEKDSGGDITIDGFVVNCDIITDEKVIVKNGGKVVGRVESNTSQVTIESGSTVYESVRAKNKVDIDNGTVRGPVTSEDDAVDVDDGTVEGDLTAHDDVSLPENAKIQGSVTSENGDVYVKDGSEVGGSVTAESGDVDIDGGSEVGGSVTAESGNVDIDGGSVIVDHAYVAGSFSCSGGSTVNGESCADYTPRSP